MVDYNTIIEVDKDYYNLDDIMATKTTIGCTYGQETPSEIFKIIGQKPPEQIPVKGYKTETPIWMAEMLCTKNVFHVQPQVHRAFVESRRNGLKAKPEVANLEDLSLHYYLLGKRVAQLISGDEGRSIAHCLLHVFMKRSGHVFKLSIDPSMKPMKCDSIEKKLFSVAQISEARTTFWFHRTDRKAVKRKFSAAT